MNIRFIITFVAILFIANLGLAQKKDTTFYDADWKKTTKENADFYRVTTTLEDGKRYAIADYFKTGEIQMTGTLISLDPEVKDGDFVFYHKNGQKQRERTYKSGTSIFSSVSWDENGAEVPDTYEALEKKPKFPGGMNKLYKYIAANFNYPESLKKERPKGSILLSFIVDKSGSISEVTVIDKVHPLLDAEAVKVVSEMPRWEPGMLKGKPVRVIYRLPLNMN